MKTEHSIISRKSAIAIFIGMLMIVLVWLFSLDSIDSVLAYMFKQSDQVTNVLEPAAVSVDVEENFDGQTKSNVCVRNNGDVPVYIRVTLVEYWKKDGDYVPKPDGASTHIVMGSDGWLKNGMVYYYTTPVAVGEKTTDLVKSATATIPEGYTYHLDVYAEAIQAKPVDAVTQAWKVTVDETGKIVGP